MPRKPNKAGQEQNYVPAGNGDASGEYADNESGSNIHFTNFKKPEKEIKVEPKEEQVVQTPKIVEESNQKQQIGSRFDDLSLKQKREIVSFVSANTHYDNQKLISYLRSNWVWGHDFGDLSNFNDEELSQIIDDVKSIDTSWSEQSYWFKKGGKWYSTRTPELEKKQGYKLFTEDEKDALIRRETSDLVEKSQTDTDKEIQNLYGDKTVVCFGKGYKKEDTIEIVEATKVLVNEYPDLKGFVKEIGDRNNLEKYLNAISRTREISEEEINNKIAEIKKWSYISMSDEELRQRAEKSLRQETKVQRVGNAYAYWSPSQKRMIFQGVMKKGMEEKTISEFNSNWKSSDKVISVYYHEMGHAIDSLQFRLRRDKSKLLDERLRNGEIPYEKIMQFSRLEGEFKENIRKLQMENRNEGYNKAIIDEYNKKYGTNFADKEQAMSSTDWDKRRDTTYKLEKIEEELASRGIKQYNVSRYATTNQEEFVAECFAAHYTNMNNDIATQVVNLYKKYIKDVKEFA